MSEFIQKFRAENPAYNDMSDDQLVGALHNKFYSDIPIEQFNQRIGFQPLQAPPALQDAQFDAVTGAEVKSEPMQPLEQQPVVDAFTGADRKDTLAPQKSMMDLVSEKLSGLANLGAGAVERAGDVGGALLQTIGTVGQGLEKKAPLGGFVWADGDVLPSYKSPEEFAKTEAPSIIEKGANALKGVDLGYQEQTNWQDVKNSFAENGPLSGTAYADVLKFGIEQGVKSVPDMVAAIYALPTYIFARSGEIGEQRAINKGKDKAELNDVLEAAPFAIASSLLERIGAKGITEAGKGEIGKKILEAGILNSTKRVAAEGGKALSKEAATEAIQEGMVEYVGERYGTKVAMDWREALDRAAAGAVAGGVFGAAGGAATAGAREITYSPEKVLARAMEEELAKQPATSAEQQVIDSLSPDMAQIKVEPKDEVKPAEEPKAETTKVESATIVEQEPVKKPVAEIKQPEEGASSQQAPLDKTQEVKTEANQKDVEEFVSLAIQKIKDNGDIDLLVSNLKKSDLEVKMNNAVAALSNAHARKVIDNEARPITVPITQNKSLIEEAKKQLGINQQLAEETDQAKNRAMALTESQIDNLNYTSGLREIAESLSISVNAGDSAAVVRKKIKGAVLENRETFNQNLSEKQKEPVKETKANYGSDPVKAFDQNKDILVKPEATPEKVKQNSKSIVSNKDKIINDLNSLPEKEITDKFKVSGKTKRATVKAAYGAMLESNIAKSTSVTTFNGSETLESQVMNVVDKQTELDLKKAAEDVVEGPTMSKDGKITYPAPKEDINTKEYKKRDSLAYVEPKDGERIFHAPGHNYIGMHRSTGIPARREFVTIEGRKLMIPESPQRIEPIMRKLIQIAGRRIYFGKIKGKSMQGFYRPSVGEIRTRRKNDIEVLAHELAHYLDEYSNVSLPNFRKLYEDKAYNAEVKALSYTDASPELMGIEGFAEFVRLWLTNSPEAQIRAPNFYEAFTNLLAKDRKLLNPMRDMQDLMHKFYFQGPDKLAQALIGKDTSFLQRFEGWKYRRDSLIRQQVIDRFHAARKVEQELTNKIGNVQESAWKQFRIANGGAEGIADYIMNYGTVNFDSNGDLQRTGASLHEVLAQVKTIKLEPEHKGEQKIDLLMRYFAGRRALELHRQGRENLIPKESAKEWARLGKTYPVFESIHKEFQAFNDRMMDFYEEAGMITAEGRQVMQSMNKDYVPFNRIRDQLSGGSTATSGFKKLKGGTANLNDILVNIQDGVTANVRAALNNRAKQRLYQYISNHKDGAIFATKIAPDSRKVQVYADEMTSKIEKVLELNGIEFDGDIDLAESGLLEFWQHGVKPKLNESGNLVDSVIINGKPKYYEVQDPLLQDMLIAMNPESYSSFMNIMFGVKNFFTRTITLGVEFTGANLVRDTIGATFISKNGFKPFIDSFRGMYSFITKDKYYQDFIRSGGGYSSRIEASTREGTARRRVKVDEFGIMTAPEKLLSTIDNLMSAFEYGTRIGEFRLAKKANRSDMDAGFNAREISTDFSVLGSNHFLTGYIRTVPFLNAMVQSQDRVFREIAVKKKYDGNPTGLAMKAFLGITVPTLILYLINKDDEDYKQIPDYEKRTNWHIKIGDGQYLKIPRPYDVGFVFATMPEIFVKYLEDEKGKEFAQGMIWTLTQMYGIDGTPALMTGWWDLVKNKKWTGAPVVPQSLANVEAPEQYTSNTSETFVRLGEATGLSPVKSEHMFKAYTGYLGGYLLWGTDHLLWDESKFGPKPDRKASDNIFLSRFLTPDVRLGTASMEKFFDLKEQSDKIVSTFKQTVDIRRQIAERGGKPGNFKDDKFYGLSAKEKEVLFALNDSMNDLIKIMYGKEGIKTAELKIKYDKNLTGEEKRQKLDQLWTTRNKAFMQYYNQADKALQKAKAEAKQEK